MGYSPRGRKKSDATERLHSFTQVSSTGAKYQNFKTTTTTTTTALEQHNFPIKFIEICRETLSTWVCISLGRLVYKPAVTKTNPTQPNPHLHSCGSALGRAPGEGGSKTPSHWHRSRAKTNRVLPRKCTGHNKYPLPTTQEKTLYMDITRWSTPKSD